jgi:3-hydroxyisobutyrate dehydrogenase-like beta-hydroxyacid dehydrogenase
MSRMAILHPGQMGAEVGRTLVESGHDVFWLPAGRGAATRKRAEAAGLVERDSVDDCEIVMSVCPPAAALDNARRIAGFGGLYFDANAISPEAAGTVAAVVRESGADYVDGGIIGPPPVGAGTTRLYLSGERADDVAAVFHGTRLGAVVLPDKEFAASSLKMSYAAWTKITAALLVSIRAAAAELGVDEALAEEWALSQPDLGRRYDKARADAAGKGWRWEDEMRQIARTFAAVGQPAGFGGAAADVFSRWPRRADR